MREVTIVLLVLSLLANLILAVELYKNPMEIWNLQDFCYKEMRFLYMRGCLIGTERPPEKGDMHYNLFNNRSPTNYCSDRTSNMEEYMIEKVNEMGKEEEKKDERRYWR